MIILKKSTTRLSFSVSHTSIVRIQYILIMRCLSVYNINFIYYTNLLALHTRLDHSFPWQEFLLINIISIKNADSFIEANKSILVYDINSSTNNASAIDKVESYVTVTTK